MVNNLKVLKRDTLFIEFKENEKKKKVAKIEEKKVEEVKVANV